MRILLASSEIHPYSKTGGLADMVGALGKTLARLGHQVGMVTPLYSGIRERFPQMERLDWKLDFPLGTVRARGQVYFLEPAPNFTLYFVDQPGFFQRAGLYQTDGVDFVDNAERFIFFSKTVANLAQYLTWKPHVLHLHDWQAAPATLLLHHKRRLGGQGNHPGLCMTIHNLAYQGIFSAAKFSLLNLPWEYFTPDGIEFYRQMSCLKAGLVYADRLTTVSPRYAREITTEEFGCGLDGLLRQRNANLSGILNGVDYEEWKTTDNPCLKHAFTRDQLEGKAANKRELQKEFGLPVDDSIPLFASIGRLVEQKGVDLMLAALEEMLDGNLQFVLLGTGSPAWQNAFQELARRFPSRAAVQIGFDQGLSHRIEAGCDFFLMPSRFEPCGLNQMYSLRYGGIPIVRKTGGLDDAVTDITENAERADGIKFGECSARALAKGIRKALALYEEKDLLGHFRRNAMAVDFSWDRMVGEYVKVYENCLAK